MSTKFQPDQVQDAIVALLEAAFEDAGVNVASICDRDFDQDDNLITVPPAARVFWSGESLGETTDNQRVMYDGAQQTVSVLLGARNLRASAEEQVDALRLISKACNVLAGARLQLADGAVTPPVRLIAVSPFSFNENGTWFELTVTVECPATFDGAYA